MWDLATIRRMNEDTGHVARARKKKPYKLKRLSQLEKMPPFPFPDVGSLSKDYDRQYTRVGSLFASMGDWGPGPGGALSASGLKSHIEELFEEHGPLLLAIEEVGQFQCYIGVWKEA
jgi:hypothetical protein